MHRIATMCRVLGVSPSGYYARLQAAAFGAGAGGRGTEPTDRSRFIAARVQPMARRASMPNSRAQGIQVGRKRVARLMRAAGLRRREPAQAGSTTTVRDRDARPAPDLVERNFARAAPNRLWVADITYIPTWAGFLYLAVVLDAFSRRIVGWAMETHLRTELVLEALNMALGQRRPAAVIHHSDQGSQYTSLAFGQRCDEAGVRPSMGSVGDCFDNAMCESFFATLECELLDRRRFKTQIEARMAVFEFIEGWYNPHRRHSALDYLSPIDYERTHRHKDCVPQPNTVHRIGVTPVDGGAGGINGPIEVTPAALHANIGLIDPPGLVGRLEMAAQPLFQFRDRNVAPNARWSCDPPPVRARRTTLPHRAARAST